MNQFSLSLGLIGSTKEEDDERELTNNSTKRQLSQESQINTNQGKTKLPKIIEGPEWQTEPREIDQVVTNWQNIHPNFIPQLIQAWQNQGFTYQQARDWINIYSPADQVQAIQEPEFHAWLRDIKQVDSDWVLNHGNRRALRQEFQQQAQILHQPFPSSSKK